MSLANVVIAPDHPLPALSLDFERRTGDFVEGSMLTPERIALLCVDHRTKTSFPDR